MEVVRKLLKRLYCVKTGAEGADGTQVPYCQGYPGVVAVMKSMRVAGFFAVLLLAAQAGAQLADPGWDSSGIYFSESATDGTWCTDASPGTTLTAYLCLTKPTDTSGYVYWEGRLEISGGGQFTGFSLRGDATNAASSPVFEVSYGTPLPYNTSASTVVLELSVLVQWEYTVAMRWWPLDSPSGTDDLPVYRAVDTPDGEYISLGYSNGWDSATGVPNWCASINDLNCLDNPSAPTREISWSEIKTLYR